MKRLKQGNILPLETIGSPILEKKSIAINEITDNIVQLSQDMIETMYHNNGIGLAAPQIGKNIRMFVIDCREHDQEFRNHAEAFLYPLMPLALINPVITKVSDVTSSYNEGCLSVPTINAEVIRPESIHLQARLIDNSIINLECFDLIARCVQHEIDHLDGVLFTDILAKEQLDKVQKKIIKLRKKK